MLVTNPAVRFKGGDTLLENKSMKSSSGIAGDTSVVVFFLYTGG